MQRPRFEVPEALVMEILSKLPVKSLTRFNCVCKYWCSFFQTPHFISKHYHNNVKSNNLNLVLQRHDHGTASMPYFSQISVEKDENFLGKQNIRFPFFKNQLPYVYGARHGLFCLNDCLTDKAAIWNPSTREFKILPPSSAQRPTYLGHTYACVYFNHGAFVFDSKADDYKFIRFVTLSFVNTEYENAFAENMSQVELYSLKCDSWKEISSPNYTPCGLNWGDNYLDGICYWETTMGYYPDEKEMILSFDMANEKFSVSPIPKFFESYPEHYIQVLVFNKSLGVFAYPVEGIDKSFNLWVMNEGIRTQQFSIESIPGVFNVLGFWKNGEMFLLNTNCEVVLFDPSTQEFKVVGNQYLHGASSALHLHFCLC
ncbi:hypothetical protein ES332_A10G273900v1 [Gossypium tomentosum]|uniref:F-box domain-containing protein n=1 Tax=Gossypium tomentosum TaxID=34277 RepID=A0A5D2NVJ5_GOSTO|nr:hypothetical protein ES332_A10G273900v1 [Gossypium tomentosum]